MQELSLAQISTLKTKLQSLQVDLMSQLELSESATGIVTLDQTAVGRVSRIDAMQQQKMAISTQRKTEQRLKKVYIALAAIESGDYGFCRQCDESIIFGRLEIQPEANLCLPCQSKADQQ